MIDAIAAIGDAADIRCWSGIPFYFGRAARARGKAALPWRLPMDSFRKDSFLWNLGRVLAGQRFGGYQYSEAFLDWAERTVPATAWQGRIFSFGRAVSQVPQRRVPRRSNGSLHRFDLRQLLPAGRIGGPSPRAGQGKRAGIGTRDWTRGANAS